MPTIPIIVSVGAGVAIYGFVAWSRDGRKELSSRSFGLPLVLLLTGATGAAVVALSAPFLGWSLRQALGAQIPGKSFGVICAAYALLTAGVLITAHMGILSVVGKPRDGS